MVIDLTYLHKTRHRNPEPEGLLYISVSPINKKVFQKLKDLYNSSEGRILEIEELKKLKGHGLVNFLKKCDDEIDKIKNIFKKEGIKSFFALKEHQKYKKIIDWYLDCLISLYRYIYLIDKEFNEDKKKYSAEEISFLYFMKEIEMILDTDIPHKEHLGITMEDAPYDYEIAKFLKYIPRRLIYIIHYLKELGYTEEPKGINFEEAIKKYSKTKKYNLILDKKIKDKKIHNWLIEETQKLKKELRKFEKRKGEISEYDYDSIII